MLIYLLAFFPVSWLFAQEREKEPVMSVDSVSLVLQDSVPQDSVLLDSMAIDSLQAAGDTIVPKPPVIEDPINYNAEDSMIVSLDGQKVYLYNNAKVSYQNIELTAYYIELDLETKEIYAEGTMTDTSDVMVQKPLFKQGSEEYESETMRYNFDTEKAFISKVVTQQGEGYIHSEHTKKISEDEFITKNAKYTTCDADHPHFYLQLSKAKVISNKRIITGPAYMVLEDFPIYFPFLPFGYFPNSPTYSSGVIIPTYGEETSRGFFLSDGGYYWAANDYFDLTLLGSIYSKGSWGASVETSYKKRYKFSGSFGFDYSKNKYGEQNQDDYYESKQFKLTWSHSEDSKANPNRSFSASVNLSSSGYDSENSTTASEYLSTTKSSSIAYSRTFENTPFNLSVNLNHSQSSSDTSMTLSLPQITFSMSKIYPFKRKNSTGKKKFYENFGITYTGNAKNTITAHESEILGSSFTKDWENGIKHSIPIAFPSFNLFNNINVSPGISYNEKWYFKKYNYTYEEDADYDDNPSGIPSTVRVDTITGLNRVYDYSYSLSTSATLYGMYIPKNPNSRIRGIRHKMTPTISFSYKPDFGKSKYGYWQEVQTDSTGTTDWLDVNTDGVYGGSPSMGETGSISFGLTNNVEMKVAKSASDTSQSDENYKTVSLLDNLSISSSYNLIADSLNLSTFSLSARTTVAGISINSSATIDPYMINDDYDRINKFAWNERSGLGKLGRVTAASLSFGLNFNSKKDEGGGKGNSNNGGAGQQMGGNTQNSMQGPPSEVESVLPSVYDNYVDFSMPWDLSLNYALSYTGPSSSYPDGRVSQTLGASGNLTITEKWKASMSTNFDIQAQEFSYTTFTVTRDLHCWGMTFNFVPFGSRQSYSFTLAAKSSMLSDLKIRKQKSYYDSY